MVGLPQGYASRPVQSKPVLKPMWCFKWMDCRCSCSMWTQHFCTLIQEKTREEAANAPVKPKFEAFKDFGSEEAAEQAENKDVAPEPEQAPLSAEAACWQAVPDLAPIIVSSSGRSPDVSLLHLMGVLTLFLIRRCAFSVVISGMCIRWLYQQCRIAGHVCTGAFYDQPFISRRSYPRGNACIEECIMHARRYGLGS